MAALKRRHFGVLLATFALVMSFFGLAQFVGAQAPASAAPLSCPEPTTNVSNKVTLDWDNAQLVDHAGRETKAVGDALIERELQRIPKEKVRTIAQQHIEDIRNSNRRDFRF